MGDNAKIGSGCWICAWEEVPLILCVIDFAFTGSVDIFRSKHAIKGDKVSE